MSHFELDYKVVELHLRQIFTISRGSKPTVTNVFVRLQSEGITGYGEAAPNARYEEDADKVIAYLEALPIDFFEDINSVEELARKLAGHHHSKRVKSAETAIEMAWLDWWGKKREQPLWKLWNAPSHKGPVTSFTIGLDELEVMQQKVKAAAEYPVLKIKLGTERDREIIAAIRDVTTKPLRVDANEGWKTLKEAKSAIDFLAEQNVEMVEQPMPAEHWQDLVSLKEYSPIPLCADESVEGGEDLQELGQAFDIINIKLAKTGSLIKAKQIIDQARKAGLDVMIGCMIESSMANTAGALLSLWADYADLDGHLLIADDPFEGLQLDEDKHSVLSDSPGFGVKMVDDLFL